MPQWPPACLTGAKNVLKTTLQFRLTGPWSWRDGFLVLVVFAITFTAFSFGHMQWVKMTVGFEAYLGDGPRLPPQLLITSQAIKAATLIGVVWWLALRRHQLSWRAVGFVRCAPRWLWLAVLAAVIGFGLRLLLAKWLVTEVPDWAAFVASPYGIGDASPMAMLGLIGMTLVVTPVAEEIFFRGFLFQWMATHRPVWLAMLITAIMFGVSHIVPPQIISAALMSILIILLYLGSRSIWPCIVCHMVNNGLGMFLGMAAVAGKLPAALTP